jgi:anti-sigma regulatory factor (Ser/Thr protein kinase)
LTSRTRVFLADPAQIGSIREFVMACAVENSFTESASDLLIGVTEACSNAILHSGSARLTVSWDATGEQVSIVVRDEGVFRPTVGLPEVDGRAHRGIQLMMASMDQVDIVEGSPTKPGTRVSLVKRRVVQPTTA